MNKNLIISVRDTTTSITEPLTVQEVKDWMRLEGFTAVGGTEQSFTEDDTIITMIIKAVREQFEKITSLTLTATRTKVCVLTNQCGDIEIPFGPVKEITAAVDSEGTSILADVKTVGEMWLHITYPCLENMKITYTCGYGTTGVETLPQSIKMDMLRACAYYYMNRGDEANVNNFVSQLASKYSRTPIVI